MDTGSHLLFGATMAGLAMFHPEVSGDPHLFQAVLIATMVGSHAPDLDTFARIRGYSTYIRIHRGVTHSLPAIFLWPLALALPIAWGFGVGGHVLLIYVWSFAAVFFHIFLDWMNAYGVQCFHPFSKKWQHLDVLALFDPFLFTLHAGGLVIWLWTGTHPGETFLLIYLISALYIGIRVYYHAVVVRRVQALAGDAGECQAIPGLGWLQWQFVMETEKGFVTGLIRGKRIEVKDRYEKGTNEVIEATKSTDGVRAFLNFAQRIHVICHEEQDGYIVQWREVRFWHNHRLPFGVDVKLNRNMEVLSHSIGWKKRAWDPPYV